MLSSDEIQKNRKIFTEMDKTMSSALKVLCDINRYRIFRILTVQPKLTVSDIAQILDISLPLASQHLKILATANLLQKERDGKKVLLKLEKKNPFVLAIAKTIARAAKMNRSK